MNRALSRAGAIGIGFALITICAGLGLFYLANAAYTALAANVGASAAGGVIGVALITPLAAFLIYAAMKRRSSQLEAQDASRAPQLTHDDGSIKQMAIDVARTLVRERPLAAAGLAVAAGAFALRHPGLLAIIVRRLRR
ncbi:MAG: hypothetical protein AB7P35_17190 [Hyphomonadaceae bacterium]